MKLLAFIAFTFLLIPKTFSQTDSSRWQIGVQFSPDYCYRIIAKEYPGNPIYTFFDDRDFPKLGYTVGALSTYKLNTMFELQAGLTYSLKSYRTENTIYYLSHSPSMTVIPIVDADHYYHFLSIPVGVNGLFGKQKLKLLTNLSLTANYQFRRTDHYTFSNNNPEQVTKFDDAHFFLGSEAGVGFSYQFNSHLNFRLLPVFRYGITKTPAYFTNIHLWSAGINIGAFYSL